MENCILCSTELKFLNTPTFSSEKLNDGNKICTNCFKKIAKIDQNVVLNLKKYSVLDIKNIIIENESLKNKIEKEISDIEYDKIKTKSKIDEIKDDIKNIGADNISMFLGRKEINELPNILSNSERVDNIIQGTYDNGQGVLISTNSRLVFIDKGLIYGLKVEDFPLDKISSIQYETGLIFGKVKIYTSGNTAVIDNIEKTSARKFAEFVRNKLSQPKELQLQGTPQIDIFEKIEKLAKLKESGILSEEEFMEQKKKLLEKL